MLRLLLLLILVTMPVFAGNAPQTSTVQAGEVETLLAKDEISWPDLRRLAELTSPSLSAARNAAGVLADQAHQAAAYPNPTLGLDIGEMSTSDTADRKEKVSLSQPLILGGRRGAAVDAAWALHESATQQALSVHRDIMLRLRSLWLQEFHHREKDQAYQELLEAARRTLDIAQTRFEARAAPESQVTRALLGVYDLEVGRQDLDLERAQVRAELKTLLGGQEVPAERFSRTDDGIVQSIAENLSGLDQSSGHSDHPTLIAAQHQVDAAKASLHRAKAQRIPDLDLVLAYGRNRAADDNFVEFGLSLPLPLFNRNQGNIAARRTNLALAQDQALLADLELQNQLAVSKQRYRNTRDQLEMTTQRILPAAQRGLQQAQEGYRVGRVPFLELMDAQSVLATARLRSIKLRHDLALSEAQLMSLMGTGTNTN